ncbi:hypothetical protein Ancab_011092, partial [Ancistrocladus abbreviatus]
MTLRPSRIFYYNRKSVGNKDEECYIPEYVHNQGPRIEGGSIDDSGIENMNRIFLERQHHLSFENIWEGGKLLGATPVSEEAEIVARIKAMEDCDKFIWRKMNSETVAKSI